ncbi:MAG: hypothetical protein EOO73_20100 [Myxococcales bacterium]|nr:MAG: hypothetical protein EOO73_20100 [Myxococcales bacterium]
MRLSVPTLLGLLLLVSACEGPEGTAEPVATTTHALLRIERSAYVGAESEATGVAFAGIVRVPVLADPEPLLRLFGKSVALPSAGQCAELGHEREAPPASELSRAEFLKAGDVLLGANDSQTLLAPRAFPLEVAGFVYTSRDQASASLPSGGGYLLKTSGSEQLAPLEVRVQAPEELRDVTVAGYPLTAVESVDARAGATIAWRAGDPRDVVYVEVAGAPEAGNLGVCAFRDSEGFGALPRGLFGATGSGSLTFHRLREVAADVPSLDGAEVRFDFALTAPVAFH